jgi:hypothetical protein
VIARRDSLTQALADIEAGTLAGASTIVMSSDWWHQTPAQEQDRYRARAERAGVRLHADASMSRHFVEIRDDEGGLSLSSEHPT